MKKSKEVNETKKRLPEWLGRIIYVDKQKVLYDLLLVVLIPIISIGYNEISENRKLLNDINSIAIGSSQEYIDDCFGIPIFQKVYETSEIDERIYNNEYSMIRAYFKNNSLIGFFVTSKEQTGKIKLPHFFASVCNNKSIGEFTYSEIEGYPLLVSSYITMGVPYQFYGEKYYFASSGNYYFFYFADMSYGESNAKGCSKKEFEKDCELEDTELECSLIYLDRNMSYPNTYGIISEDIEEIEELSQMYTNYDFIPLIFK